MSTPRPPVRRKRPARQFTLPELEMMLLEMQTLDLPCPELPLRVLKDDPEMRDRCVTIQSILWKLGERIDTIKDAKWRRDRDADRI